MAKYDVDAIIAANTVSSVAARYMKLERAGTEYKALCPFHNDRNPSLTINDQKGFYHCFACGAHGDVISLVKDLLKVSFTEACAILGGEKQAPDAPLVVRERKEAPSIYADLKPLPLDEAAKIPTPVAGARLRNYNTKRDQFVTYEPVLVHPYMTADGQRMGIVVRNAMSDGTKYFACLRLVQRAGDVVWAHMPFDLPRPIYGLELIKGYQGQVLVVEGEKSAEAARRVLGGIIPVVAWVGGAGNHHHIDWTPLAGCRVVVWLDADKAGDDSTNGRLDKKKGIWHPGVPELLLAAGAADVKAVQWDTKLPEGYDAADMEKEGCTAEQMVAWLKERATPWVKKEMAAAGDMPPSDAPPAEPDDDGRDAGEWVSDEPPFAFLGHDKGTYYYFPAGAEQVRALTPSQHTVPNLASLAPLSFWIPRFRQRGGTGKYDLVAAQDWLMTTSHNLGIYDFDRVRGRGAWMDAGRVVIHTGAAVYVDGVEHRPGKVPSNFIYQAGRSINLEFAEPAGNAEAHKLVEICERLTWESQLCAHLLVGWIIMAPVCGILEWRPHIWICGSAKAGKSTVVNRIVKPMIEFFAEMVQGGSTEASLRRELGADARPCVIDEIESEDKNSAENVKRILGFMRIASSGGTIKKANGTGGTDRFTIRTSMMFSSINNPVSEDADVRRITKLVLRRNDAPDKLEHFKKLKADIISTITPNFAARMFARTVANMPTLLKNVATFTAAAATVLNDQGAGDKVGGMIAGLYLCYSTKEISYEDAVTWIEAQKWSEFAQSEGAADETRLLSKIMTTTRRIIDGNHSREFSVGELILRIADEPCDPDDTKTQSLFIRDAKSMLGAMGIRVMAPGEKDNREWMFYISNQSSALEKILEGTPWAKNWNLALQRLGGEGSATKQTYFSAGIERRATRLPVALLREK